MNEPAAPAMPDRVPEFPVERSCPFLLPEAFDEIRAAGPVSRVKLYDGRPMWAVTRHPEARAALTDPRLASGREYENLVFPVPIPALSALDEQRPVRAPLIASDRPEHTARRRVFIPHFTVKRLNALRPDIEAIVNERLDRMLEQGHPVDLRPAFALPIPSIVICRLLGVPYEDHDYFEELTMRRFDPVDGQSMVELYDYLDQLVGEKAKNPGSSAPGLLDDVLAHQVKEGVLDHAGLVMFALELLIGGHDTTANMITSGMYTLLCHPEQLAALRADPSLLGGAIEELLRALSIPASLSRVATEDIELGGQTIRAGDGVLISPMAANHDETVFQHPGQLDIRRPNRDHIAFGYGAHQCIGQNLARIEMEIAFRVLLDRVPTLRLAVPVEEVPIRQGMLAGVWKLPVAW